MFLFHFLVQENIHLNDVVAIQSVPIAASGSAAPILNNVHLRFTVVVADMMMVRTVMMMVMKVETEVKNHW